MTNVPGLPAGCRLVAYETVDSTNDEAKRLIAKGAVDQTYVWAQEQTAGRGRRGNHWLSPKGNMYLSAILRPTCKATTAAQLGFVAAVALAEAIESVADLDARVKWPNDLLIDHCKVSGILVESASRTNGDVDWVVIGTGVNIVSYPHEVPGVTSLSALGTDTDTVRLIEAYVEKLHASVVGWQRDGFAKTRRTWLARATKVGQPIRVRLTDREEEGIFEDLDETGALVLAQPSGRLRIASGDVFPAETP